MISSVVNSTNSQREIREKKEALKYLEESGIVVGKNVNYAKLGEFRPEFWINPQKILITICFIYNNLRRKP